MSSTTPTNTQIRKSENYRDPRDVGISEKERQDRSKCAICLTIFSATINLIKMIEEDQAGGFHKYQMRICNSCLEKHGPGMEGFDGIIEYSQEGKHVKVPDRPQRRMNPALIQEGSNKGGDFMW